MLTTWPAKHVEFGAGSETGKNSTRGWLIPEPLGFRSLSRFLPVRARFGRIVSKPGATLAVCGRATVKRRKEEKQKQRSKGELCCAQTTRSVRRWPRKADGLCAIPIGLKPSHSVCRDAASMEQARASHSYAI